ncbi:MAG: thioredoxin family protein [Colwellia sp.]|nr:thioredoxin family protein [Colwellia sp.]MCW8864832.1 thioredoxin family protein [Colwellia sp.]MCW9081007.1 thioredoxin family protein [Colwellia sp.]
MKQLTSANAIDDLISQHEYTLLYFSASWCGPCQSMSPIVEGISSIMSDRFNTIKIDIDNAPTIAADYGIRSVPTMMLVKHNEIIDQRVGGLPPQQLMQWLEQHT